jgi:ribonuclease inhibitor
MRVELDCRKMTDRKAAHAYLKQALALPVYYGNNLDALYDLMTDREEETVLVLGYWRQLGALLGDYGISLLETLREASEAHPKVEIILKEEL